MSSGELISPGTVETPVLPGGLITSEPGGAGEVGSAPPGPGFRPGVPPPIGEPFFGVGLGVLVLCVPLPCGGEPFFKGGVAVPPLDGVLLPEPGGRTPGAAAAGLCAFGGDLFGTGGDDGSRATIAPEVPSWCEAGGGA
jgi:hypothetical protein